jgi:hypothetical protein
VSCIFDVISCNEKPSTCLSEALLMKPQLDSL